MATLLFDQDLLPSKTNVPEGYSFRPLQRDDYHNGHLEVLQDLAFIGTISEEQWTERFDQMKACPNTYFVLVIVKDNKIVGSGTLVVEKKL